MEGKTCKKLDEALALFAMRDYDKTLTKEERKKDKLVRERLLNVMKLFDEMMAEINGMKCKHLEWIAQLDKDIHDYILKYCMWKG